MTETPSGDQLQERIVSKPQPVLEFDAVAACIGDKQVLRNIDLQIQAGEFIGLVGPNGSGKTSLIKTAIGQLTVRTGTIRIAGFDVRTQRLDAVARVGYAVDPEVLPQQLTGEQVVKLAASAKRLDDHTNEVRTLLDLLKLRPFFSDEIGTYSTGTKQKVSILMALLGKPPLILLDESLNSLDPVSVYHLKKYLSHLTKDCETAVLLASHAIETVEKICTRVAVLIEGRIETVLDRKYVEEYRRQSGKDLEEIFIDLIETPNPPRGM